MKTKDVLPENFVSPEELSEFWDAHSTADYGDYMESADVQTEQYGNAVHALKKHME